MHWLAFYLFATLAALLFLALMFPVLKTIEKKLQLGIIGLSLIIAMSAVLIYKQQGALEEVMLINRLQATAEMSSETFLQEQTALLRELEDYVDKHPEDAEYWFILAGIHMDRQDFSAALSSYQKASELLPEDMSLYSRMAEAQFLADDYQLTESVRGYIDRVLASNPNDTTVLGILGISAYRAQQYEAAINFWERSLQNLPPFSPAAESVRASIEQARITAGLVQSDVARQAGQQPAQEISETQEQGIRFQVQVSLADTVAYRPTDTVFVFARQYQGPPMPVVVQRLSASQLPLSLSLDDSMVMIQGTSLANYPQLELVARLSFSGSPAAQPGDYEVVLGPVNPTEIVAPIQLVISDRVN